MKDLYEIKIASNIIELNEEINEIILEDLKERGLTPTQTVVFRVLAQTGKITLTDLSRRMSTRKATASGIVDRLDRLGLIKKEKDDKDKRVVYIDFSEKGKELEKEIRKDLDKCFIKMFNGATEEELIEVFSALDKAKEIIRK